METEDNPPVEDFAQALAALKDEYQVSDSDVARAVGVTSAAVGKWVHRQSKPRRAAIEALAEAYPKFTRARLFAATKRATPGDLSPDAEDRILDLVRSLPSEHQEIAEAQLRAHVDLVQRGKAN